MKSISVTLRPADYVMLAAIGEHMESCGLMFGRGNRSDAIRYAIEVAYHTLVEGESRGEGEGTPAVGRRAIRTTDDG